MPSESRLAPGPVALETRLAPLVQRLLNRGHALPTLPRSATISCPCHPIHAFPSTPPPGRGGPQAASGPGLSLSGNQD